MSSPSLCMLVRLMVAQVQECVFERLTLTTADTHFASQLRLAQEAARVSGRGPGGRRGEWAGLRFPPCPR